MPRPRWRVLRTDDGKPDEQAGAVALQPVEGRPREYHAKLRDLPAGRYAAELAIPELGEQLLGPPGDDGKRGPLRCRSPSQIGRARK